MSTVQQLSSLLVTAASDLRCAGSLIDALADRLPEELSGRISKVAANYKAQAVRYEDIAHACTELEAAK